MLLSRTPTPDYHGQPANGTQDHSRSLLDWLTSLFRTSTPAYEPEPERSDDDENSGEPLVGAARTP